MLTKDLWQYSRRNGYIKVKFLEAKPHNLELCETLLGIYRDGAAIHIQRETLDESLIPILKGSFAPKTAAGLNKILSDHCEFSTGNSEVEYPRLRRDLFRYAARILQDPPADAEAYQRMVQRRFTGLTDIYGDLPDFDRLQKIPAWTAAEFLNRYNTALVQGLLLNCSELELSVEAASAMELRKFMRRLKFYRLLAEVGKTQNNGVKLTLSGPAAVLGEGRKYGLQLASFFPVILLLEKWKLHAVLQLNDTGPGEVLNLSSERCTLYSYIQRWASCVPEEVLMFIKSFRSNAPEWLEMPEADFPRIAGEGAIFPDFSFARSDAPDKVIHLELFHRWHASALEERLSYLAEHPAAPLLIGVDRSLLGNSGEADFVTRHPEFEQHGFFFSNFPGVDRVRKKLNALCKE